MNMERASFNSYVEADCPYIGLFAFDEAHARYFFGREGDAELIAANVLSAGAMILHGPSGVGKSSVLGAAFPKALERIVPNALIIPFRRWDAGFYTLLLQEAESQRRRALLDYASRERDAVDTDADDNALYIGLGEGETASIGQGAETPTFPASAASAAPAGRNPARLECGDLHTDDDSRTLTLNQVAERWEREVGSPIVFVFDQFEQYFTGQDFGSTTEDEQFEAELAQIIKRRDVGCHVLISIREDALFELNRLRARIPNILTRSLKLDYLDRAAAEEAINGPLGVWRSEKGEGDGPTHVAPDLIDVLISQVSRPGDATRIETPYLQLALKRLWQEEHKQGSAELRSRTLDGLGGAGGIAESHFKDTIKRLPEDDRRLCAVIFDRMVTPSGMKIALAANDLAGMTGEDAERVGAVLEKLAAGRSLIIHKVASPQEGPPLFEIFHDVLARPIVDWIAAERERVKQERKLAEQRRAAEEARRRQQEELERQRAEAEREHALHQQEVARQRKQISHERQLKRRYFGLFVASGLLAVAAIGAAGYAVVTHREAAATRGRMLSSQAQNELGDGDGRASLLLSLAALPNKPGVLDEIFWPERQSALRALDQALAMPLGANLPSSSGRLILANLSADGRRIVTASETGVAQVWDDQLITGRWKGENSAPPRLLKHDKPVEIASASFDRTGELLLTADFDGGVYLWNSSTGERWAAWKPHDRPTTAALAQDGTLIATASYGDVQPRLWQADPWNSEAAPVERKSMRWGTPHKTGITGLAFDTDGGRLVSTSFDGTARVWRTCDGALLLSLTHGGPTILAAAFSPDGRRLVTGSWDGTARLWGLPPTTIRSPCGTSVKEPPQVSRPLLTFRHDAKVTSVAFDATGRQIITAALDGAARIWDASSGVLLRRLQGPEEVAGRFASAVISPDGGTVLATFMQRRAYLWPLKPETTLPRVKNLPTRPLAISASADGQRIAVADDSGLQVFNAASGDVLRTIPLDRPPMSVAMSPGGVFVAAAVGTIVGMWSSDGEEPSYRQLPDHGSLVLSVAYDEFGQRLVTTCQDGTVRVWDATGRALLEGKSLFPSLGADPEQKPSAVFSAKFSKDGSEIFAGSFDGWLRVADAMTGKELPSRSMQLKRPILGLALTNDQHRVVADMLVDTEEQHSDPSVIEHDFSIRPMLLDVAAARPVAASPAEAQASLEMLQFGNALELIDGQNRHSTIVVPFDRGIRLGPLPPDDPAGRWLMPGRLSCSRCPVSCAH
ncbi:MAG: WD40 repeat domain-containing protein [Rhodospirillales bacterium]|nr:WD40 repeat domain-containing protein [Rhodospirillales bacterium]